MKLSVPSLDITSPTIKTPAHWVPASLLRPWCAVSATPHLKSRIGGSGGASLVEFALSVIPLLMLLIGLMELGLALYSYEVVNESARAGARYAMVHGSTCLLPNGASCWDQATGNAGLQAVVRSYAFPGMNPNNLLVTASYSKAPGAPKCVTSGCTGAGDQVTVTVSYSSQLILPFRPSKALTLVSSSAMIISQ
jgi:Flp pilus assembly protein TadG